MADSKFSRDEALRFGWDTMKSNLVFFIILFLIFFFVSAIGNGLNVWFENLSKQEGAAAALAVLVMFLVVVVVQVVSIIMQIGLVKIALEFVDSRKPTYAELFNNYRFFWRFLFASILYVLILMGGFLLLIVPGIVWALKYGQFTYLIVDKKAGIMESIKKSGQITYGAKWDLFVFGLLLLVINIAGALCFLVGLFATVPTTLLAMAHVYRQLLAKAEAPAAVSAPVVAQPINPQIGE